MCQFIKTSPSIDWQERRERIIVQSGGGKLIELFPVFAAKPLVNASVSLAMTVLLEPEACRRGIEYCNYSII
jgi:hypothetical protein